MAEPKTKSIQTPPYIQRHTLVWQSPEWLEADRWRRVVRQQPVAIICRDTLITYLQALPWEVRAKEPAQEDELADEIEHYNDLLKTADDGDFDSWMDRVWQDALDLPVGGTSEIVRFPDGFGPFDTEHPKGHVAKVVHIDGATLLPTFDAEFPFIQRHKGDISQTVTFRPNEIARILLSPRPELERKPYGMAPPERIYLAITMLFHGDRYYASLLLDTPEAGILDLADMSHEAATQWLSSFRELMTGIDPFKIPVLYDHQSSVSWIPFGRPPTDMLYDTTTLKYARITAAGYWLTLSDIGLGDKGDTLSGQIRDERKSRRTGFGVVKEKTVNLINAHILPPHLEFNFIEKDEEALVLLGRARLLNAQAMKAYADAGVLTQTEARDQTQKDGLITIELDVDAVPALPAPAGPQPGRNGASQQMQNEKGKVPAAEGGRGDLVAQGPALGDTRIAAVPKGSEKFSFMAQVLRDGFNVILNEMTDARLEKLVRRATELLFPAVELAAKSLTNREMKVWRAQRLQSWFDQPSEFDDMPDVLKAKGDILTKLETMMAGDDWYKMPDKIEKGIYWIEELAYEEGATEGIKMVNAVTAGLHKPSLPQFPLNFELKNPETLNQLERKSAQLIQHINDGTRFYIARTIVAGVDQGLASPKIAQLIRDGANVEAVLRDAHYKRSTIEQVKNEVAGIMDGRANSIANTEIARAETEGRLGQWRNMGLKKKDGFTPEQPEPVTLAPTANGT